MSIKLPASTLHARTQESFINNLILQLAVFMVIFAIVIWIFRKYVTSPLLSMGEAMRQVARGHYDQRISGFSGEFATLSDNFNHMTKELNAHQEALKTLNNELEDRVEQRTQELNEANQKIHTLNKQLRSENVRMSAELDVTRKIQQMLLPNEQELKLIPDLDIAGFMEPASEVGGDYYDVLQYEGKVKIGIGDVTGHGLESGMLMLMVQMAVRTLLTSNITDPKAFMEILNRAIFDNIKRMGTDKNLTLALLDYDNGKFNLSGQHEDVLIMRHGGLVERIDTTDLGFWIGVESNISDFLALRDIHIEPGEGMVLYTDGITEARNTDKRQYSVERLCTVLSNNWQYPAEQIRNAVIEDVHAYIGSEELLDDLTLLVFKRK